MQKNGSTSTVILADGSFPESEIPLSFLKNATRIVCCDGASRALDDAGYEPYAIVGDCDSIDEALTKRYADRIFRLDDQETNDLTKAVRWCHERGFTDMVILGGTGKREDHTLGNISLLAEYAQFVNVRMVTDTGIFYPLLKGGHFKSVKGQQISIFSIDPQTEITSSGLKYPLNMMKLSNWWQATLNEAEGDSFGLEFEGGVLIVFVAFT
jgi:thiamine pyrophosphokinase